MRSSTRGAGRPWVARMSARSSSDRRGLLALPADPGHGRERAGLGHAPGLQDRQPDFHPVGLRQGFGTAEPPQTMARSWWGCPASSGRVPIQMVGTPAVRVTPSVRIRLLMAWGERSAPGNTRSDPASTPAWHSPQALAWNMGTTGRTTSVSLTARLSARQAAMEWRTIDRWEYTTPWGLRWCRWCSTWTRPVLVGDVSEGMRIAPRQQLLVVQNPGVVGDRRRPGRRHSRP